MKSPDKPKTSVQRIGGYLHKVIPIVDSTGKIISHAVSPLKVELRRRDIMQILVGASILSVPVAFTEETWVLGQEMALANVILLGAISIVFIALHVYFNFYRRYLKGHVSEYIKRVIAIYVLSFLVVGGLLSIIGKALWQTDTLLAIKRTIIVTFPASMSATVSDGID
jgi:uncharacterized membrane protein